MRTAITRCRSRLALAVLCAALSPACAASTSTSTLPTSAKTAQGEAATPPQPRTRSPLAGVLGERGAFAQIESLRLRSGCTPALCGPHQIENYEDPAPPGCTPTRCSVQVDAVERVGEAQELRVIDGARSDLVNEGTGPDLELADRPFSAARVGSPDAPWGCALRYRTRDSDRAAAASAGPPCCWCRMRTEPTVGALRASPAGGPTARISSRAPQQIRCCFRWSSRVTRPMRVLC